MIDRYEIMTPTQIDDAPTFNVQIKFRDSTIETTPETPDANVLEVGEVHVCAQNDIEAKQYVEGVYLADLQRNFRRFRQLPLPTAGGGQP